MLSSCSCGPSPHCATPSAMSSFILLATPLSLPLFLPLCSALIHSSSTVANPLGCQDSCQTFWSHSSSTTSLVNLHLLYRPFLFSTLPLIWILTASRTWRSRLLLHFLTRNTKDTTLKNLTCPVGYDKILKKIIKS